MLATKTVPRHRLVGKLPKALGTQSRFTGLEPPAAPQHGVLVLIGHTIRIFVDHGHLTVEDGLLGERRVGRFPRVHHGLRRVVVIGTDGFVSLSAIRWMADQGIGFAMLERDGSVLINTGPVALSDTRLRRAQALAQDSPAAVEMVRDLICRKLTGQRVLVHSKLRNSEAADSIAGFQQQLTTADTINVIRQIEGKAGFTYWAAWKNVAVQFPKSDFARVPHHWRTFGTRHSPLSYNARKATNPINAILNYLYTVLESETRLAVNSLGLDPGFGLLHTDSATRDSLVYDLMEPIRPDVDAYVLDWIFASPLRRSFFFEQGDGTCRLMAPLAVELSQTATIWAQRVAPIAEWFAQELCSATLDQKNMRGPGTRITQQRRKQAKTRKPPVAATKFQTPTLQNFCLTCGDPISTTNRYCASCGKEASTEAILLASERSNNPRSLKKRSDRMAEQCEMRRRWSPDQLPNWLTAEVYATRIQPILRAMPRKRIQDLLDISDLWARRIASGAVIPHKRHWVKLAELAGVSL